MNNEKRILEGLRKPGEISNGFCSFCDKYYHHDFGKILIKCDDCNQTFCEAYSPCFALHIVRKMCNVT